MPGQQATRDDSWGAFGTAAMLIGLTFAILVIIWFVKRMIIVDPVFLVLLGEDKLALYGYHIPGVATYLSYTTDHHIYSTITRNMTIMSGVIMDKYNPQSVTIPYFESCIDQGAQLIRPLVVPVVLFLAFMAMRSGNLKLYNRNFTYKGFKYGKAYYLGKIKIPKAIHGILTSFPLKFILGSFAKSKDEKIPDGHNFMEYQAQHWRHVITSVKIDPDKEDPDWAPAMTPLEWAMKIGCVNTMEIDDFDNRVREGLRKQIGAKANDIRQLPVYAQAILALAWTNLTNQKKVGGLAGDLAEAAIPHQLYANGKHYDEEKFKALATPILQKTNVYKVTGKNPVDFFNEVLRKHTGWRTAMVAAVAMCGPFQDWDGGNAGVFPPSTYLWVKGVDRTLWYALNNVGAPRFKIEGLGPIAQWKKERMQGKRVQNDFHSAIRGVRDYFDERAVTNLDTYNKQVQASRV